MPFQPLSALDGDEQYRTDVRLSRVLPITERLKVTLMFEAFNVFNHHYYAGTGPRITREYSATKVVLNGTSQVALVPNTSYGAWGTTSAPLEGNTARRAQVAVRIDF